jgi:iron complex outermembrane receptor protein
MTRDDKPQIIEEIVTVGTRSLVERTATETMVPVSTYTGDDMRATGETETARMLQMVSPSFNFSTSTISDGTDILRPATLRGLNPDQTLVLVNGKRRHTGALMHVNGSIGRGAAGVDLNAIPASSIQRIEVLRDGASALYGSDAIAGVINVVLKDQSERVDPYLQMGQTYENDGGVVDISVNAGWPVLDTGYINVTGEYRDRQATNRAGDDPNQLYNYTQQVAGTSAIDDSLVPGDPGFVCTEPGSGIAPECSLDLRELDFDRLNHRYGDPDSENWYFSWNAGFPVSEAIEVYTFGGIARREGESGGFYRRASNDRTVLSLHPDGFLPLINTEVDDDSVAVGVRGTVGEWYYDASATYGENEFNFTINNSNNVTLGDASPTNADAGTLGDDLTVFNFDVARQLDVLHSMNLAFGFQFMNEGYSIAAGEATSWQNGLEDDDNPATMPSACVPVGSPNPTGAPFCNQFGGNGAPGIQVFPGFRPSNAVDQDRNSYALYVDAEVDVTERWLIGGAVRWEDYDGFDSVVTGKLATRWSVVENFALRGSASTGFRAPSMQQLYFNNVSTQFRGVPVVPQEVATFNVLSPVLGPSGFDTGSLEEETSVNLSAGLVWTAADNFTITTDLYYIAIEDRIVLSGQFESETPGGGNNNCTNPGDCPIKDILDQFAGVTSAQFFTNAIDTETTGIDIVADWVKDFPAGGQFKVSGGFNFNSTELDGTPEVPPTLAAAIGAQAAADTLYSRQEIIWMEDGQPDQHHVLSTTYNLDKFTFTAIGNYFGEVKSTESSSRSCETAGDCADQTFGGAFLLDLVFDYQIVDSTTLTFGVNNLFDKTPDANLFGNNSGIFPFSRRTTPFGFNGGFYYMALNMSFGNGT